MDKQISWQLKSSLRNKTKTLLTVFIEKKKTVFKVLILSNKEE